MGDVARPMLAEVLACVEGIADPAEAQETLVARGLLPEGWCQDVRRGWYFDDTYRTGTAPDSPLWYGMQPRTIPDLVAVASLGVPAILSAEALAQQACVTLREHGCPQPERVVWRVGVRSADTRCWIERTRRVSIGCDGRRWLTTPDQRYCENNDGDEVKPIAALWLSGLALDAIDRDAVRIVVPPVGGV